ncbi:hypothetical protein ACP4OV_006010 [Aristida adscensionis]
MAPPELDLNLEPPELDMNSSSDWSGTGDGERDGRAHELGHHMVSGESDEVQHAAEQGQEGNGDGDSQVAPPQVPGSHVESHDASVHVGFVANQHVGEGPSQAAVGQGGCMKRRRFYSDDLKVAIYLELLARTDPPVLRRGVSKAVSAKFDVPLRVVQSLWRNRQDYEGIEGVKNKMVGNCGRKRIEINIEAIEDMPLTERTSLRDLGTKLGVAKSTLHKRLKEG